MAKLEGETDITGPLHTGMACQYARYINYKLYRSYKNELKCDNYGELFIPS